MIDGNRVERRDLASALSTELPRWANLRLPSQVTGGRSSPQVLCLANSGRGVSSGCDPAKRQVTAGHSGSRTSSSLSCTLILKSERRSRSTGERKRAGPSTVCGGMYRLPPVSWHFLVTPPSSLPVAPTCNLARCLELPRRNCTQQPPEPPNCGRNRTAQYIGRRWEINLFLEATKCRRLSVIGPV